MVLRVVENGSHGHLSAPHTSLKRGANEMGPLPEIVRQSRAAALASPWKIAPRQSDEVFTLQEPEAEIDHRFNSPPARASGSSAHAGQAGRQGTSCRTQSETQTTARKAGTGRGEM